MWVIKHDPMMFSGHEKKTQALLLQEYIAYSLEISGSHATSLLLLLLSHFSHVRLCNLMPGILQARTLEWVAISFSCYQSRET